MESRSSPSAPPEPTRSRAARALLSAGLVLAAAAPLAWTRAFVSAYAFPKLAALCLAALPLAAGLCLSPSDEPAQAAPLDLPLLACLAAVALSAAFSVDPRQSLLGHYDAWAFGLWPLALCALVYHAAARAGTPARRAALKAGLAAAAAAGLYSVAQACGLDPWLAATALPFGARSVATLGSPVYLGAYLALWLPLALHWTLAEDAVFGGGCLALAAAGLAATLSRGAWAGAAAGCGVYLALSGRWSAAGRRARAAGLALLVLAAVAAALVVARRRGAVGAEGRLSIWGVAARAFEERPLLGQGPDTFEESFRRLRPDSYVRHRAMEFQAHAHNDLLQALSTTGLIGAAAYVWLLLALLAAARRGAGKDSPPAAAAAAGLLALWLNMEVNIVALPVLACAALLAAELAPARAGGRARRWGLNAAAAALALASAPLAWRIGGADREEALARKAAAARDVRQTVARFSRAVAQDPCALPHREVFLQYLAALAPQAPPPARPAIADAAAALGPEAVACHPRSSLALTIRGYGELLQAGAGELGKLPAARADLEAAGALDPKLMSLLALREEAARLSGDAAAQQKLAQERARLQALMGR